MFTRSPIVAPPPIVDTEASFSWNSLEGSFKTKSPFVLRMFGFERRGLLFSKRDISP